MFPEDILLLNDGSPLLHLIGGLLSGQGHNVGLIESPEEVLDRMSTQAVGLIVVRLNGEEIDRLAVLSLVKRLNPAIKLIILSDDILLPTIAYELEADDYILLPCRAAEVWRRIAGVAAGLRADLVVSEDSELLHPANRQAFNSLALMFHDLYTSLASIATGLEMLKGNGDRENQAEDMAILAATYQEVLGLKGGTRKFLDKFWGGRLNQSAATDGIERKEVLDIEANVRTGGAEVIELRPVAETKRTRQQPFQNLLREECR